MSKSGQQRFFFKFFIRVSRVYKYKGLFTSFRSTRRLFVLLSRFSQRLFWTSLEEDVLINVELTSLALSVLTVLSLTEHFQEETSSTAWEGWFLDGWRTVGWDVPLALGTFASHGLGGEQVPDGEHLLSRLRSGSLLHLIVERIGELGGVATAASGDGAHHFSHVVVDVSLSIGKTDVFGAEKFCLELAGSGIDLVLVLGDRCLDGGFSQAGWDLEDTSALAWVVGVVVWVRFLVATIPLKFVLQENKTEIKILTSRGWNQCSRTIHRCPDRCWTRSERGCILLRLIAWRRSSLAWFWGHRNQLRHHPCFGSLDHRGGKWAFRFYHHQLGHLSI